MNRDEDLAKTCKHLMLEQPYYGLFLIMLNKTWSKSVPTAGVMVKGINYQLLINPEFWDTLSPEYRKGILQHELLHIAFFHLTSYVHLADKKIANIAMDLEINQYIPSNILPPDGMSLDLFPELNLDPKAGTHYYYDKLIEAQSKNTCPNLNDLLDAMDAGQSVCVVDGDDINVPDHSHWKDIIMDEATAKLIDNQTKHILNEVANSVNKSRGLIPGEIMSILEKINTIEPPRFDWQGYLRRFAGGSVKVFTKKTRRKYSKRFEDNPGLKVKHKKHILVALDTSGSVSDKELLEFMQEIHHISKTGADVTIAHADAAIQKIEPYNSKSEYKVYGRGGTSFDPVVDYYNESRGKYSCLIYLTDGEAPAPEKVRGRVLWVLSTKSNMTDHLPGKTIQLN